MVLTAAQHEAFFENQMLIPQATRIQLGNEGISRVHDLLDLVGFDRDVGHEIGVGIIPDDKVVFEPDAELLFADTGNDDVGME